MKSKDLREYIKSEIKKALEENTSFNLHDDNIMDDVPSVSIYIDDSDGKDKAFFEFSTMYHSGDNQKMTVMKNNPALQQAVAQVLQKEMQRTFRRVIHGILGEPFGLDEQK